MLSVNGGRTMLSVNGGLLLSPPFTGGLGG